MFWNLKMISDLDKHFGLATVLATFEKLGDFFKQSGLIALKVHQTLMAMFHLMVFTRTFRQIYLFKSNCSKI
jgi:hypothetical protein